MKEIVSRKVVIICEALLRVTDKLGLSDEDMRYVSGTFQEINRKISRQRSQRVKDYGY